MYKTRIPKTFFKGKPCISCFKEYLKDYFFSKRLVWINFFVSKLIKV